MLYVAAQAAVYATLNAASVVADQVDQIPCCTCVMCPITVASAFPGQYHAAFLLVSPGHKRKLPAFIAANHVCFTRDPAVAWRYSISAAVLDRSDALGWSSVEHVVFVAVVGGHAVDCVSADG